MSVDKKSSKYVILYAAVISGLFTAAIITFHVATADIVKRNERLLEDKALVEIFFGRQKLDELLDNSEKAVTQFVEKRIQRDSITDPQSGNEMLLLIAYKGDQVTGFSDNPKDIIGYGFPVSGVGFWARIDGVMAVSPDMKTVKGIFFLRHSETPGLGGRVTEQKFRSLFVGLDITEPADGGKFVYIGGDEPSGPANVKYNRRVDSITGATGTSRAVEEFLNDDITRFRRAIDAAGRTQPETR